MTTSVALTVVKQSYKTYPWEQQDGETGPAYSAFLTYLRLPRETRNLRTAFRIAKGLPLDGDALPDTVWYEWSGKNQWKVRARQYDAKEDRKVMKALEARRFRSLLETAELGETMRKRATTAAKMLSSVTKTIGMHEGREVLIMETALTPEQIVKLADVGVKIEQLALGNPTGREMVETPADSALHGAKEEMLRRIAEIRSRRLSAAVDEEARANPEV